MRWEEGDAPKDGSRPVVPFTIPFDILEENVFFAFSFFCERVCSISLDDGWEKGKANGGPQTHFLPKIHVRQADSALPRLTSSSPSPVIPLTPNYQQPWQHPHSQCNQCRSKCSHDPTQLCRQLSRPIFAPSTSLWIPPTCPPSAHPTLVKSATSATWTTFNLTAYPKSSLPTQSYRSHHRPTSSIRNCPKL